MHATYARGGCYVLLPPPRRPLLLLAAHSVLFLGLSDMRPSGQKLRRGRDQAQPAKPAQQRQWAAAGRLLVRAAYLALIAAAAFSLAAAGVLPSKTKSLRDCGTATSPSHSCAT